MCTRDEIYPITVTSNYNGNPTVHDAGVPPNFQDITFKNFQQLNGTGVQHSHEVDISLSGNSSHQAMVTFEDVYVQDSTSLANAKKKAPSLLCDSTSSTVVDGGSSPAGGCAATTVTLTGSFTTGINPAATNPCTNAVWSQD